MPHGTGLYCVPHRSRCQSGAAPLRPDSHNVGAPAIIRPSEPTMRRVFDFLRFDDVPHMARPNYAAELRHITLWAVFANLVDGSFSSIVVAKTFHSPLLVPIVWATPMLAHLLSLVWGIVVRGRPKVRTFIVLALCALASAGSIAFTPSDWHPWGGWLFAAQVALARIFLSGLVTVRTSMWKSNYPQSHRARIAGRIQTLSALLMLAMGATVSLLFDEHAEYYRVVYPAIAVIGVASLLPLRRVRVRGEPRELKRHRRRMTVLGGAAVGRWTEFVRSVREAAAILKRDRAFARYCSAQYLLGSANFMVDPVLTLFLTQKLHLGYFGSYLLLEQIPTVVSLVTIQPWAHLFDRVGVLRFRVFNSAYWLASIVLAAIALPLMSPPLMTEPASRLDSAPLSITIALPLALLILGRVANGLGRGGGSIAWNLGHLHFAGEHDAELYMGIHVALTGLRGLIMPSVGTALYALFGPGTLALGVGFATAALLAFRKLARAQPEPSAPCAAPAHSPPRPDSR